MRAPWRRPGTHWPARTWPRRPSTLARSSMATWSGCVRFGRECVVDPVCKSVTMDGRPVKKLGAIIILHYLNNANESQPTGRTISYRQLSGGNVHYPAFKTRVIEYIGSNFHQYPLQLVSTAELLGAKKQEFGDASVLIQVLPKLPVTVIVWRGDDKVRGNANVLFDDSAPRFLNTEDLAAVGTVRGESAHQSPDQDGP